MRRKITPEHKKDLDKRREQDEEWALLVATFITTLGLLGQLMGIWR